MKIDVIKNRTLYLSLSAAVITIGLVGMVLCWRTYGMPFRPSVDFTGGTPPSLVPGLSKSAPSLR
jgi:preprotein translocase subunit SecF